MKKLFLIIFLGVSTMSYAYSDKQAINAIVGETAGEFGSDRILKKKAMFYVAWAIKNRKTLNGVYGYKAKHNAKEPKWIWAMAEVAWVETELYPDITFGADSWYSKEDVVKMGHPKNKQITCSFGNHVFYKTIKPTRRVSQ